MAEPAAKEQSAPAPSPAGNSGKPNLILIVVAVINMLVMGGVSFMFFSAKKKDAAEPKIEDVIRGEAQGAHHEGAADGAHGGEDSVATEEDQPVVPLETFLINLAGSKGRKIAKISLNIKLDSAKVAPEIERRKPQIRDIIINILSSKSFEEVSTKKGKDDLRTEIKDTVNAFLKSGEVKSVYFTEFIYN